ncbi:MAG: hypothetical protein ACLRVG_09220 [Coprococcus phoceensis]
MEIKILKTTKLSEYEQMRLEEAKAFIEEIKNSEYAQWEIVEIKDDNANSGFYGCMIDCGDGQSMFGFRGSESDTIASATSGLVQCRYRFI